jgi:hypothetical protein
MKTTFFALTIFAFITSTAVLSCNSAEKKVENSETKVEDANKDLVVANEEYLADVANYKKETIEKIAANEKSIIEFNGRIANEKKDAKVKYKQKIAELEMKNTDLKLKMENYNADGKENWEKFKTEFNHDMDELGKAFKDLTVKNTK